MFGNYQNNIYLCIVMKNKMSNKYLRKKNENTNY